MYLESTRTFKSRAATWCVITTPTPKHYSHVCIPNTYTSDYLNTNILTCLTHPFRYLELKCLLKTIRAFSFSVGSSNYQQQVQDHHHVQSSMNTDSFPSQVGTIDIMLRTHLTCTKLKYKPNSRIAFLVSIDRICKCSQRLCCLIF